jgi:hypothetical protein
VMGVAIMIGGGIVMARHGGSGDGDEDETPRVRSRARAAANDESAAPAPTNESSPEKTENSTAPKNPTTATPPPQEEEHIIVGIKFMQMLPNGRIIDGFFGDPDELDKRKEEIEDAILTSLELRGLNPPEGQYWRVEAIVEENRSSVQKIKMIDDREAEAPILVCKMRVKDSVGRGNYIFDMARNVELPADVIARASKSRLSRFNEVEWIDQTLWKNVTGEFKALADQFKPQGAAAPAGANPPAKTATPGESAAPAK